MTDDFQPIRPRRVPLAHAQGAGTAERARHRSRWALPLTATAVVLLLIGTFALVPRYFTAGAPVPANGTQPRSADAAATEAAVPVDEAPQRAAQEAMSRFVELQMRLEPLLEPGSWGKAEFTAALERASTGDEALTRNEFAEAEASYRAAADALAGLEAERTRALEQAVRDGSAALVARDQAAANAAFGLAASIAPADPRVTHGQARAARLPEVNDLLRDAKNAELAGDWDVALATLRRVERLDPETAGLAEAVTRVSASVGEVRLQDVVSTAFGDLDAGRLEQARAGFGRALALDPGNAAALGGIEQIDRQDELNRLDRLEQDADRALAEERWTDAEALYADALAVDPNIQFAIAGRALAAERRDAAAALQAIIDDPDRLSSQRVFDDARATRDAAAALEPKGTGLRARIAEVSALLESYATPVPVVLRSDNRTQVTVSTVGPLGMFNEKQLALRPGAYTVLGSRDGCRDVRERIVVRPDMAPVEIRCVETL
jgi:hypothetical protein